jgi:hypothetical protein
VRSSKAAFLFVLFCSGLHSQGDHIVIPKAAKVMIGAPGRDEHDAESDACKDFRVTSEQVRSRFRTYHRLTQDELHDRYILAPCWVDGELTIKGKTYTWRARPGNTIETTYPDGAAKMLGGKPSDRMSGK